MIDIKELLKSERVEIHFAEIKIDNEFVKTFRKQHKLTQTALANIVGVSKKTIEKWEQGVNNINGSSAVLLKLLNDNPYLIEQLYQVKVGVSDSIESEEYDTIGSAFTENKIESLSENKVFNNSQKVLPFVAMLV